MRPPEASSTHSKYCVAAATAFQVYAGLVAAMLPVGATSVAAPGGAVPGTVKSISLLQGPEPAALEVTIHHWAVPGTSVTLGVIVQRPVPSGHPAWLAVYVWRMRPPEASLTHSKYRVAVAAAFQV